MATLAEASSAVPAFLSKLWTLVEDKATDELIGWDVEGKSFHVSDQGRFAKEILPLYFKHSNIASFVRQLNMYGFRKVVNLDQGALKQEKDEMRFAHQYFLHGQEHLLEFIKRKVTTGSKADDVKLKSDDVHRVLTDVRTMKSKQENINGKLESMKRENEALWREVAALRQKHNKQQQIVNKLIQFLITMVGNQRGLGVKRKLPLMLNDASQLSPTKLQKIGIDNVDNLQNDEGTLSGVTIREVTESSPASLIPSQPSSSDQLTGGKAADMNSLDSMWYTDNDFINVEAVDYLNSSDQIAAPSFDTNSNTSKDTAVLTTNPSTTALAVQTSGGLTDNLTQSQLLPAMHSPKIDEVNTDLFGLQTDLNVLKDMLSGSQYNLDSSTILGLFNPEGPLQQANPDASKLLDDINPLQQMDDPSGLRNIKLEGQNEILGNELVTYEPSKDLASELFDLPEILLDDDSATQPIIGLLDDEPIATTTATSTLNTPDVITTAPSLSITSNLANKRKKFVPARFKNDQ